jgi:hypothetical protein
MSESLDKPEYPRGTNRYAQLHAVGMGGTTPKWGAMNNLAQAIFAGGDDSSASPEHGQLHD